MSSITNIQKILHPKDIERRKLEKNITNTFIHLVRNSKKFGIPDIRDQLISGYVKIENGKGVLTLVAVDQIENKTYKFAIDLKSEKILSKSVVNELPYSGNMTALVWFTEKKYANHLNDAVQGTKGIFVFSLGKTMLVNHNDIVVANDFTKKHINIHVAIAHID